MGRESRDGKEEEVVVNVGSIWGGLKGVVKKGYLVGMGCRRICRWNGKLDNCYGYSD